MAGWERTLCMSKDTGDDRQEREGGWYFSDLG